MDKKNILKGIVKGIGMGIISGMVAIGMLGIVYIYLQENNTLIFGKGEKETTIRADNYSRDIIVDALNGIEEQENINVSDYITDIYVVDDINNIPCTQSDGYVMFGCEVPQRNIFGLVNVSIYILNVNNEKYSKACLTFDFVIYHEIGHTLYQIRYGIPSKEDDIYRKSLETYANGIADKYAHFDKRKKEGCREYYLAKEVEKAKQTFNIAREKLEDTKINLENAKINLEKTNRDVENAKIDLERAYSYVTTSENEMTAAENKVSSWNFLDKLFNNKGYQDDVSTYNSAVDRYNAATNQYNVYKNRLTAYADNAVDAYTRYENILREYYVGLKEFNAALDNYNDKVRMELIATSGID